MNVNYLDALSNPGAGESVELAARKFLAAHAILLSLQGVPGIYFHSMFGSRGDRAGAESSGLPRRVNRQKLAWQELEAELADPTSLRGRVFGGCRRDLQRRGCHAAFHPGGVQQVVAMDPRLFAVRRISPDGTDRVLCLHNVSDETVPIPAASGGGAGTVSRLSPYEFLWVEGI